MGFKMGYPVKEIKKKNQKTCSHSDVEPRFNKDDIYNNEYTYKYSHIWHQSRRNHVEEVMKGQGSYLMVVTAVGM